MQKCVRIAVYFYVHVQPNVNVFVCICVCTAECIHACINGAEVCVNESVQLGTYCSLYLHLFPCISVCLSDFPEVLTLCRC